LFKNYNVLKDVVFLEKNNELFLNLYKKLESVLSCTVKARPQDSPIWVFENQLKKSEDPKKKARSEKYSTVRQMRNILAHDEMGDDEPFTVNDDTIEFLESEIKALEEQKRALDVCVPFSRLLYATKNSLVTVIATKMLEKGITNVPILNEKKVIGMFNGKAFIHIMKSRKGVTIDEHTKMKDIKQFLYLDMNDGIRYEFVAKDTKLDILSQAFKRTNKGKIELLIVTDSGDKYEPVLGVISPHDILERG
jgi:CBS domain-containing protein